MSDTILYKIGFCCNMSDRNFSALKCQTNSVIICQTNNYPILPVVICQTHCVIICQTGCYNKPDTFYANNLLIYCAVIYQTTGNYLILPVVICQTNSVRVPMINSALLVGIL